MSASAAMACSKMCRMASHSLDNRGLPPPEPMVRILDAVEALRAEDELRVLMDREPLLLYPELERRGLVWDFSALAQDFLLVIRRTHA